MIVSVRVLPVFGFGAFRRVAWLMILGATIMLRVAAAEIRTENVVLITIDGLRWQEVFTGAEELLISNQAGGVPDTNRLGKAFWRENAEERRAALMPFFWNGIAREGQLYGNRHQRSPAKVTNGRNFTYPGFNEILAGFPDDRIKQNAKIPNPNVTVLEWLHQKPAFTNRVAAFANWDVFPFILNARRAGIPIWTGYPEDTLQDQGGAMLKNRDLTDGITPVWDGMNFDVFFLHAALDYLRERKPRVTWIAFSEPDEWAHEGRYDLYLFAIHRIDSYIKRLWSTLQSMPEYRDKTTFILTTDHGRGSGPSEWKNHGAAVAGAECIWIAAIGPDTPALGERKNIPEVGQNQIAATLAALLGEDYRAACEKAGAPIVDLLPPATASASR